MPSKYKHLSAQERDLIAVLRSKGKSLRVIAGMLQRNPGTLSRELKRNAPPIYHGYYLPHKAQERAEKRNRESHRRPRLKTRRTHTYVRAGIQRGWSPQLTAGRWNSRHPTCPISHEAIYQWIYAEARELIPRLAHAHRNRKRKGQGRRHKKLHIPARIPITERPVEAEDRRQAGHWEPDTAVSRASKATLLVVVERKARYTKICLLSRKTAREVRIALNRTLSQYPLHLRRTLTYDNGCENVEHEKVNAVLGTRSYFCAPYHSWEKGTVENTIGLIRRFLPKKTDLSTVSGADIRRIEDWLNNRPRKCLNFRTPAEVFRDECCT